MWEGGYCLKVKSIADAETLPEIVCVIPLIRFPRTGRYKLAVVVHEFVLGGCHSLVFAPDSRFTSSRL